MDRIIVSHCQILARSKLVALHCRDPGLEAALEIFLIECLLNILESGEDVANVERTI